MKKSKTQVVEVACELFRERGYEGASMQELADRLGLTKGAIYGRFRTKEDLVEAVLAMTLDLILTDRDADDESGVRYLDAIHRIGHALAGHSRSVELQLAYGIVDTEPNARVAVQRFFLELRDYLANALVDVTDKARAAEIATDALSRLEGATMWLATVNDPAPLMRAIKALEEEFESLLKPGLEQDVISIAARPSS